MTLHPSSNKPLAVRNLRQIALLGGTIAFALSAVVLLFSSGLPNRALYTGEYVPEIGYIAPEIGAFAPNFSTTTLLGEPFELWDTHAQTVVLNFWATWCEPCQTEMPELQTLYDLYRAKGLRVIGVNLGENPAVITRWLQDHDITYPIVIDPQFEIATLYYLRGQPTTYILSPDGTITHIVFGATTAHQLESFLNLAK